MKKFIRQMQYSLCLPAAIIISFSCNAQGDKKDWMKESRLIFKGEVVLMNSSTIDQADPSETGVVKVWEIIEGKEVLEPFLQQNITVKFLKPAEMKKGLKALFYANVWIIGESIAVSEVGHEPLNEDAFKSTDVQKKIQTNRTVLIGDTLTAQLAKAELVVSGRVIAVRKLTMQSPKESEHDPQWMLAEVKVDEVLKKTGTADSTMRFAFAASNDVMWYRAPKFKEGQTGIWILSREDAGFAETKIFTVVSHGQYLNIQEKPRVRQLLSSIR